MVFKRNTSGYDIGYDIVNEKGMCFIKYYVEDDKY